MTKELPHYLFGPADSNGRNGMSQKADVGPDETFDIALNAVEERAVRGLMNKSGAYSAAFRTGKVIVH